MKAVTNRAKNARGWAGYYRNIHSIVSIMKAARDLRKQLEKTALTLNYLKIDIGRIRSKTLYIIIKFKQLAHFFFDIRSYCWGGALIELNKFQTFA